MTREEMHDEIWRLKTEINRKNRLIEYLTAEQLYWFNALNDYDPDYAEKVLRNRHKNQPEKTDAQ